MRIRTEFIKCNPYVSRRMRAEFKLGRSAYSLYITATRLSVLMRRMGLKCDAIVKLGYHVSMVGNAYEQR